MPGSSHRSPCSYFVVVTVVSPYFEKGVDLKRNNVRLYSSEFWRDEIGQDAIEYALLLGFIALAGAAMFLGMSSSTNVLWSVANNNLAAGNAGS
jgi:Flp pilus assembly pilin Flp